MNSLLEDCLVILDQGVQLLSQLSPSEYTRRHADCFNSSIGGHVRHNLDHYWSLLRGYEAGEVDYDARARDPRVETDPAVAAASTAEIAAALKNLKPALLEAAIRVKMDTGGYTIPDEAWSRSTVRRELQFLLSHTVHHYALIGVMCQRQGLHLPKGFGIAPSTLKHRLAEV